MATIYQMIELAEREEKDKMARSYGFLILQSGEAYEAPYSQYSSVFVIKESDTWSAWIETWKKGESRSINHKVIVELTSFELAMIKAKDYLNLATSFKKEHEKTEIQPKIQPKIQPQTSKENDNHEQLELFGI